MNAWLRVKWNAFVKMLSERSITDWIVAISTAFSAFFGFGIYQMTKYDWEANTANVITFPSIQLIAPNGLFAVSFINTSNNSSQNTVTDFTMFKCSRDENSVFPEKYLIDNFYSYSVPRKEKIFPIILSGRDSKSPEKLFAFNVSDTQSVNDGKSDVYLVGQVTYTDDLGNKKETRYCSRLGPLIDINTKMADVLACPIFNCVNGDCTKQTIKKEASKHEQICEIYERQPQAMPRPKVK